jgi:hypothetical protein
MKPTWEQKLSSPGIFGLRKVFWLIIVAVLVITLIIIS